jgi:diamine N-acetyltransferase
MIKISEAKNEDAEKIVEIGRKTFIETYSRENTSENMEKYLNDAFNKSDIEKEINEPNSIFLLAYEYNKVMGYAKINIHKGTNNIENIEAMEIERLYILAECFGKKVGKTLMEECLRIGKDNNCTVAWVQVWGDKYNSGLRAIEFYKKWGFEKFAKKVFILGDSEQEDILMKKEF